MDISRIRIAQFHMPLKNDFSKDAARRVPDVSQILGTSNHQEAEGKSLKVSAKCGFDFETI